MANTPTTVFAFDKPADGDGDWGPEYRATLDSVDTHLALTGDNVVVNPGPDIWQAGTSFAGTVTNDYTADQWRVNFDGTITAHTVSRQSFTLGQTAVPGEPQYYIRYLLTTNGTSTTRSLTNIVESVRTHAGKEVTVSFWATGSSAFTLIANVNQNFGTGGSPSTEVNASTNQNKSVTTSWQRFTYTFTMPSISGKTLGSNGNDYVGIKFAFDNLTNGDSCDIRGLRFDVGDTAKDFVHRPKAIELALCRLYYQQSYDLEVAPGTVDANGMVVGKASSTAHVFHERLSTSMRTTPTVTFYNPNSADTTGSWRDFDAPADRTVSIGNGGDSGFRIDVASSVDGNLTGGHWVADARI